VSTPRPDPAREVPAHRRRPRFRGPPGPGTFWAKVARRRCRGRGTGN